MFASAEKGRQGDGFITKAPIVGFGISQLSAHTYFPANNFIYDSEEFIYQKNHVLICMPLSAVRYFCADNFIFDADVVIYQKNDVLICLRIFILGR
jgi:hypothetical protein